jgi:hypothetical protein
MLYFSNHLFGYECVGIGNNINDTQYEKECHHKEVHGILNNMRKEGSEDDGSMIDLKSIEVEKDPCVEVVGIAVYVGSSHLWNF